MLDPRTLVFPSYDGNWMFLSMGNIAGRAQVGMLFLGLETPFRMCVQGSAVVAQNPLPASFRKADLLVRVSVSEIWIDYPRYAPVPNHQRTQEASMSIDELVPRGVEILDGARGDPFWFVSETDPPYAAPGRTGSNPWGAARLSGWCGGCWPRVGRSADQA